MAKSTFTPEQKANAIRMLNEGVSASDVIEEIGCSFASLQNWKKDYKSGKLILDDEEEEEYTSHHKGGHTSTPPSRSTISREEFIEQYWQTRSVVTVMKMPSTIDEVVKLINNALTYAHDRLSH
jgi:transposase-like protein